MAETFDSTARAWKATRDAKSGVFINKDKALLVGSPKTLVAVDRRGTTIRGPMSLVSLSNENRSAGMFIGTGEFTEMIPSTLATPTPTKLPVPPVSGIINIVQDVAFFTALLS